jgi:hypothetical protein
MARSRQKNASALDRALSGRADGRDRDDKPQWQLPQLLAALYRDFDARQTAIMDAALTASEATLADRAGVIAASSIDCVMLQGREIPGVIAALAGSPELEKIKRECDLVIIDKCRSALTPFAPAGRIAPASFWALLGAAEALSYAATTGEISAAQAKEELFETIVAMVGRSAR